MIRGKDKGKVMSEQNAKPNVKKISPETKMEKNASYVIFHSDDFDGQLDNKKVLALMFWDGIFGFVGGPIEKEDVSLVDNIKECSQKQINFDIKNYEDQLEHVSSYDYNGFGIHTYACKISTEDMMYIRTNQFNTAENVFDYAGAVVFNISPETARKVLSNNFGGMSGSDLYDVIDRYMTNDFNKAMEADEDAKLEAEKQDLINEIQTNPEAAKEFEKMAVAAGLDAFLDPSTPEGKSVINENGDLDEKKIVELYSFPSLSEAENENNRNIETKKFSKKEKGFLKKLVPTF